MNASAPEELAAELAPASRWLVVLDFDGVLSPIVEHPDQARPAEGAVPAIEALTGRTHVAVISGRPVAELHERLGDRLAVTFAGGHGAEVVTEDGQRAALVDVEELANTLDGVQEELESLVGDRPGWLVERKAASLAVHHRLVPDEDRDASLPKVEALLAARRDEAPGFQVLAGKAVLELRPAGVDKGRALAWIAERWPGLIPLVLGDDVTDEDAFREAAARGGAGVLVGEVPRGTVARWRLPDPEAVVRFLEALGRP